MGSPGSTLPVPLLAYLDRTARRSATAICPSRWPLPTYQTIFALEPGSAEMPSAGRPFTPRCSTRWRRAGCGSPPITLHRGVSSLERGEPPYPERFAVPAATGRGRQRRARCGGRVIAVGTTVVRALETAPTADGRAGEGWTELVITPERGVRVVDGLHHRLARARASHLLMLEAIAGRDLLERSYAAALAGGYRWHEFGDSHLLIPWGTVPLMRAIVLREFGPAENLRLEDVEDPLPGAGQARISVTVAGVHFIDTKLRAGGQMGLLPQPELPTIPGREVAGVVDAVGPDVDQSWIGRRVVAHLGPASRGYASLAVREVEALHVLPDGLADAAAVAMIGTGRTTMAILDTAAITADDTVLVTAAAGGIGTLLVQAARSAGAR